MSDTKRSWSIEKITRLLSSAFAKQYGEDIVGLSVSALLAATSSSLAGLTVAQLKAK